MLRLRLFGLVVAAAALSGCSDSLSSSNADAGGTLLDVRSVSSVTNEYRLRLYNLTIQPDHDNANEIYLLVGDKTEIYIRPSGGRLKRARVTDLKAGAQILARVDGLVFDTAPAQYGAIRIDAVQDQNFPDSR